MLTSTLRPFSWTKEAEAAFARLKVLFTTPPILSPRSCSAVRGRGGHFGHRGGRRQLSAKDGKLHPYAFFSRCLSPAERNYDVGNRELLALVLALQEWRHWLEGAAEPFLIWAEPGLPSWGQAAQLPASKLGPLPRQVLLLPGRWWSVLGSGPRQSTTDDLIRP